MKKSLPLIAALLLLTAALITAAGCTTTTDPVAGNWVSEKTTTIDGYNANAQLGIAFTFNSDGTGTGMLIGVGTTETTEAGFTAEHSLTWKKTAADTYAISIHTLTGTVEKTLSLDGDKLTADDGLSFVRAANNASGAFIYIS